jgi:hypothetical protein
MTHVNTTYHFLTSAIHTSAILSARVKRVLSGVFMGVFLCVSGVTAQDFITTSDGRTIIIPEGKRLVLIDKDAPPVCIQVKALEVMEIATECGPGDGGPTFSPQPPGC